jgi:DNA mismatch endonuclease (patch repair protein)
LVFPRIHKAIFVHGCFWHRHPGCSRTTNPKTRAKLWAEKFKQNTQRDKVKQRQLKTLGWDVLVIWECETFDCREASRKLERFLSRRN